MGLIYTESRTINIQQMINIMNKHRNDNVNRTLYEHAIKLPPSPITIDITFIVTIITNNISTSPSTGTWPSTTQPTQNYNFNKKQTWLGQKRFNPQRQFTSLYEQATCCGNVYGPCQIKTPWMSLCAPSSYSSLNFTYPRPHRWKPFSLDPRCWIIPECLSWPRPSYTQNSVHIHSFRGPIGSPFRCPAVLNT